MQSLRPAKKRRFKTAEQTLMYVGVPIERLARRIGFSVQEFRGYKTALLYSEKTGLMLLETADPRFSLKSTPSFAVSVESRTIAERGVLPVIKAVNKGLKLSYNDCDWRAGRNYRSLKDLAMYAPWLARRPRPFIPPRFLP